MCCQMKMLKIGHDSKRDTGSIDFFMPIDNDVEADAEPAITLCLDRALETGNHPEN